MMATRHPQVRWRFVRGYDFHHSRWIYCGLDGVFFGACGGRFFLVLFV